MVTTSSPTSWISVGDKKANVSTKPMLATLVATLLGVMSMKRDRMKPATKEQAMVSSPKPMAMAMSLAPNGRNMAGGRQPLTAMSATSGIAVNRAAETKFSGKLGNGQKVSTKKAIAQLATTSAQPPGVIATVSPL